MDLLFKDIVKESLFLELYFSNTFILITNISFFVNDVSSHNTTKIRQHNIKFCTNALTAWRYQVKDTILHGTSIENIQEKKSHSFYLTFPNLPDTLASIVKLLRIEDSTWKSIWKESIKEPKFPIICLLLKKIYRLIFTVRNII